MNIKNMYEAVDLLYTEWDLGKVASKSKGKICAWIYLIEILEESEVVILEKENRKLVGFCGYAKWNSKKHLIKKKIYYFIKNLLYLSPSIKDKEAVNSIYDYTPEELKDYFDGEISVIVVNKKNRGKGLGRKMLLKVFELAKKDSIKNLQILAAESCNFKFYENCDCKRVYETVVTNGEINKNEIGYIYEKRF